MNAAHRLEGLELDNGWTVGKLLPTGRAGTGTGGFFSVSYEVSKGKQNAFLKAFDIFKAIENAVAKGQPLTTALQRQTQAFDFETNLHNLCLTSKMRRIVQILDHGQAYVAPLPGEQLSIVPYMIMELADGGDVRSYVGKAAAVDIALKLSYLKDVASGIRQLHGANIAHQDLKPSNVMVFGNEMAKIGDLGRASRQDIVSLHDHLIIAGDPGYAPPEQVYRFPLVEWFDKRMRCDLYQFASLITFLFFGVSINAEFQQRLPLTIQPLDWGGGCDSYEHALPYLTQAFNETLRDLRSQCPDWLADSLIEIIAQCGNPDYKSRGSKKTLKHTVPNLGIDRFVSELDRLVLRSTIETNKIAVSSGAS